jgi:hypothetical protein
MEAYPSKCSLKEMSESSILLEDDTMQTDRVFTEEELKEMSGKTLDGALAAIESSEKEKAKELCNRMYQEFTSMHDIYMHMVTGLFTEIYRKYGVEALEQIERGTFKASNQKLAKLFGALDLREKVKTFLHILRGHLQPVTVEEDDEKICLTMKPCGSGQRLVEQRAYKPPLNYEVIQEPHDITWGMPEFPIYCTHEPVLEMLAMESGSPISVCFPAEKPATEPCRFCFYKDPKAIPKEFYTRVGKRKPDSV